MSEKASINDTEVKAADETVRTETRAGESLTTGEVLPTEATEQPRALGTSGFVNLVMLSTDDDAAGVCDIDGVCS